MILSSPILSRMKSIFWPHVCCVFQGFCWIEPSGISTYLHQGAVEGKNASSLPVDVGQYLILILFVGGFARLQGETQRDFLNSESWKRTNNVLSLKMTGFMCYPICIPLTYGCGNDGYQPRVGISYFWWTCQSRVCPVRYQSKHSIVSKQIIMV